MSNLTSPVQHHKICDDPECSTCFQDSENLEKYLLGRIGGEKFDVLSELRQFVTSLNLQAEFGGWPSPHFFDEKILNQFVEKH